jgi:hypothetical protein
MFKTHIVCRSFSPKIMNQPVLAKEVGVVSSSSSESKMDSRASSDNLLIKLESVHKYHSTRAMGAFRTNAGPGQPLPRPRLPPPTGAPNQWRAPPWTGHGSSGPPPWGGQGPSRPPPWAGQGSSGPPPGWGPPPQRPPAGADAPPWNQGYQGPGVGEYDQNYGVLHKVLLFTP